MEFSRVTLDIDDAIATVTLNHPEVLNATSPEMLQGLGAALDVIEAPDSGVRCIVLTGAGRAFCAGANLQGRGDGGGKREAGVELEMVYHPMLRRIRGLSCPIVSAVNGAAAGIGMSFALKNNYKSLRYSLFQNL